MRRGSSESTRPPSPSSSPSLLLLLLPRIHTYSYTMQASRKNDLSVYTATVETGGNWRKDLFRGSIASEIRIKEKITKKQREGKNAPELYAGFNPCAKVQFICAVLTAAILHRFPFSTSRVLVPMKFPAFFFCFFCFFFVNPPCALPRNWSAQRSSSTITTGNAYSSFVRGAYIREAG